MIAVYITVSRACAQVDRQAEMNACRQAGTDEQTDIHKEGTHKADEDTQADAETNRHVQTNRQIGRRKYRQTEDTCHMHITLSIPADRHVLCECFHDMQKDEATGKKAQFTAHHFPGFLQVSVSSSLPSYTVHCTAPEWWTIVHSQWDHAQV